MSNLLFPSDVETGTAEISPCATYRYLLTRTWDERPAVCFVMLNPSTADAARDDPTIRRCIGYAKAWGSGGVVVANLFALRATDPRALREAADPIGPRNDHAILEAASGRRVIAAWGTHGVLHGREAKVMKMLTGSGVVVECLARTKHGRPKHPLYCRADLQPVPFAV